MRALSAAATLVTGQASVDLRYLLKIVFTVPAALTLRLSDQPITALGYDWLPLVDDWGALEAAMNRLDVGGRPTTATLRLNNTVAVEGTSAARLSDLIYGTRNASGYQWAFAKASVYALLSPTHTAGDEVLVGTFYLEDPQEVTAESVTVTMSDLTQTLEDKLAVTKVTRDLFASAPPSAIGRAIPVPFGVLRGVPAVPIIESQESTLDGAIGTGATTLTLVDASTFPASGTVQIDSEHIAYAAKDGNDLIDCTRAQNGTTAAAHPLSAAVYEVRTGSTAYRYAVGENVGAFKMRTVRTVRVDGAPPTQSPSIALDVTTIVTGKSFAVISFPGAAKFFTDQAITATRTVAVSNIAGIVLNGGAGNPASPQTRTVAPSSIGGTTSTDRVVNMHVERGGNLTGTVSWTVKRRLSGGSDVVIGTGSFSSGKGGWQGVYHSATYDSTANEIITCEYVVNDTNDGSLAFIFDSYKVTDHASVRIGGGPTSIGTISCDVDGLLDDGSGTISGTPSLLLENPVDIARLIHLYLLPLTTGDLGTTWATARTALAALDYRWALLLEPTPYSDLRRQLGEQSRCVLYASSGTLEMRYLESRPDYDVLIDYARDIDLARPAVVRRTPRANVVNSLVVSSEKDHLTGAYRTSRTYEDLGQVGLSDRIAGTLELPYVQDATTAADLGAYWLDFWKRQHWEVDLAGWHNLTALEIADHLTLANHPTLAIQGPMVFRVIERRDGLRRGAVELTALEIDAASTVTSFSATEAIMAHGSRGNRSQRHASTATQWTLAADVVILRNAALSGLFMADNPASITLDIATAGPIANGRDQAGAFTVSSWIHFYWIWNGSLLRGLASATAPPTGPTLPTGYTHWAYDGAGRVDGAGNLVMMYHRGRWAEYEAAQNLLTSGTSTVEASLDLSALVPANAEEVRVRKHITVTVQSTTGHGDTFELRHKTGQTFFSSLVRHQTAADALSKFNAEVTLPFSTAQTLYYIFGGHGGNGGTTSLTVDVLAFAMPNGAA